MIKFIATNVLLITILSAVICILTAYKAETADASEESRSAYCEETRKPIEIIIADIILTSEPEQTETSQEIKNRWNLELSAAERDLLARITMLEAGGESDKGQQAVAEVILNRVVSEEFPDSIYEVLSQESNGCKQFVTWKNRNEEKAAPSERVLRNVDAVLDGETNILPYRTLYFSLKAANDEIECVIGNHVFCNQPYK